MHEETSLHLLLGAQHPRQGVEQDQLLCGSTGTSLGNCREMEACMVRACQAYHDSLSKTILQGTLEGGWRHDRQMKCWKDNIKEWTFLPMPELPTRASCRKDWKRISAESSLKSPWWPNWSRDWSEPNGSTRHSFHVTVAPWGQTTLVTDHPSFF